jgi:hypothetical protein
VTDEPVERDGVGAGWTVARTGLYGHGPELGPRTKAPIAVTNHGRRRVASIRGRHNALPTRARSTHTLSRQRRPALVDLQSESPQESDAWAHTCKQPLGLAADGNSLDDPIQAGVVVDVERPRVRPRAQPRAGVLARVGHRRQHSTRPATTRNIAEAIRAPRLRLLRRGRPRTRKLNKIINNVLKWAVSRDRGFRRHRPRSTCWRSRSSAYAANDDRPP